MLVIVLRLGISSAFFRFYFDSKDEAHRTLVVRTSFWFTMAMATAGLVAGSSSRRRSRTALKLGDDPWLVRAAFVGLWAQMNYEQLTSLFRVEERSTSFVIASLANVLITVGMTVLLVVGLDKGATGAVVGNFIGTLCVYLVLLVYRRYQLGLAVLARPPAGDEPVRDAARPVGARALGDQLHRPDLHRASTRARPRSASTRSPSGSPRRSSS